MHKADEPWQSSSRNAAMVATKLDPSAQWHIRWLAWSRWDNLGEWIGDECTKD